MLVKTRCAFALVLIFLVTSTPATANNDTTVLTVTGASLVVVETSDDNTLELRTPPKRTVHPFVLEASPSHLVLVVTEPEILWIDHTTDSELTANVTSLEVHERAFLRAGALATSFTTRAGDPLLTIVSMGLSGVASKEELHEIDPDPDNVRTGDWTLPTSAVAELGPGWYFFVRGREVLYEMLFEGR